MKVFIILTSVIYLFGCRATTQMGIYNPYPDKRIVLENNISPCADSYQKKLWYILYGNYMLSHINAREIFPSSDYTYKIEQVATVGDKVISFFAGLFLTINRKTLIVKSCQVVTKDIPVIPQNLPSKMDLKLEDLEKEVSFLKGKISGIETTVGWMNPPVPQEQQQSQVPKHQSNSRSMNLESDSASSKILSMNPREVIHQTLLFKRGSFQISKSDRKKIRNLRDVFSNPFPKILIIGSADTIGTFKGNLSLSWKRAQAVKNEMVQLGIPKEKIMISGAGENREADSAKLENSRRVDIYLVQGGEK